MSDEQLISVVDRSRFRPTMPIASVVVNFSAEESKSIDENIKMLTETITSILLQDYVNLEVVVVSDCIFWQEYVKFATKSKTYGNVVKYIEFSAPKGYEILKECINGEYGMLIQAGETLTYSSYVTEALDKMVEKSDIGLAFADFSVLQLPNCQPREIDKMSLVGILATQSWTKIPGQWLFLNYDKAWCMPGTTIFRWKLFIEHIDVIRSFNNFSFLRMLPEINTAFFNHTVGICRDILDDGTGRMTLEHCDAALESIDLATVDSLIAGFNKTDVQNWQTMLINKYFYDIIKKVRKEGAILHGLYDVAQKHGVVRVLYQAMIQALQKS